MHEHPILASWIEVYRCRQYTQAQEFALVLVALGIDHRVERQDDGYRLLVAPENAGRARTELVEYEAETQTPPPAQDTPKSMGRLRDALNYWGVLLVFHILAEYRAFALDWLQAGKAHALLIREGEWWRTVTALTLHAECIGIIKGLLGARVKRCGCLIALF